jgi:NAD(P)-dependent dehydrogenase (short-subunit alcohol dehydrogenase family)
MSVLLTTQAVAPHIIQGGRGGAIINVASTEALRAAPGFAVYAACKAGVVSFTKTMALELAAHNIRSFALAPDMISTPGLAPLMNASAPEQQAARDRYIPNGRMGLPEEFGRVVAFLASDLASYLNGVTLPVDAGATAAAGWYRNPDNQWCLYHCDTGFKP